MWASSMLSSSLLAFSASSSPPVLPHWAGPKLDPVLPHGGVPYTKGASFQRLFFATPAEGTYNHMPMIDEHEGRLFAWWKSPKDEDQPGEQRIMSSQLADGVSWTAAAELFPKLPVPHVLFAEPMLHVNNRSAYIAASPTSSTCTRSVIRCPAWPDSPVRPGQRQWQPVRPAFGTTEAPPGQRRRRRNSHRGPNADRRAGGCQQVFLGCAVSRPKVTETLSVRKPAAVGLMTDRNSATNSLTTRCPRAAVTWS